MKTEFWWASIHGADPEPVEKTEHDGRPCVYTLGCADPFYLDEPGVLLFDPNDQDDPEPMHRPRHPDKAAAARAAQEADRAANNAAYRANRKTYINAKGARVRVTGWHGWRGPR